MDENHVVRGLAEDITGNTTKHMRQNDTYNCVVVLFCTRREVFSRMILRKIRVLNEVMRVGI